MCRSEFLYCRNFKVFKEAQNSSRRFNTTAQIVDVPYLNRQRKVAPDSCVWVSSLYLLLPRKLMVSWFLVLMSWLQQVSSHSTFLYQYWPRKLALFEANVGTNNASKIFPTINFFDVPRITLKVLKILVAGICLICINKIKMAASTRVTFQGCSYLVKNSINIFHW